MIVFTGYIIYQNEFTACKKPLAYDIGVFDGRFGISRDEFLNIAKEAEIVWEKDTKSNLLEYKPGSKFKINLIFDNRQETTIESTLSKENIQSSRSQYDKMLADYKTLETSYEIYLSTYNNNVATFESRLNDYNIAVQNINSKGGATPKEFKTLDNEKKELEYLKSSLDSQRIILNGKASELNSLGDTLNSLAKELNIGIDIHNQRFGEAREFEQGQTIGRKEIDIYQFDTRGDLRLVLAHEFGHALGLEHTENPKSIMYYLMDEQDINNPSLSQEDMAAIKELCRF